MLHTRSPATPWPIPDNLPRSVLLEWVRANAPDLRILRQSLEDGRLACLALFTFRGEEIRAEAVQSPDVPDPADTIVRRCAEILYHRMGIKRLDDPRRRQIETLLHDAIRRGDTTLADRLGHELVTLTDGR